MFDIIHFIQIVGVAGICAIVFLESGIIFGFFLPGDSLLFTAGLLASQGFLSITILFVFCSIFAIAGDSAGYWTGKNMGRALFEKEAGFFFKKKRLHQAETFYQKHGKYTIILARFIPIIRTFAPIVAGVARMDYKTFLSYNIIGGILWAVSVLSLGYFLGNIIPNPDRYILPIIIAIVFISLLPVIISFVRNYFARKNM
ncbi:MAG: VTT domain-containing protein [Candidatus Nomurabacteria bacterium]|nr:VTT domain-containing protein [Candidatus Nomurabacteria bacterium]